MDAPEPKHVELHLYGNPTFTKFAKQVKALGGHYSACRGHQQTRYVVLPWTEEGRKLANRLFAKYGTPSSGKKGVTVIARGVDKYKEQNVPAWVTVHYIPKNTADPMAAMLELYRKMFQQAVDRSIIKP